MQLREYLDGLKECPDEELTDEFGISDNWPILMRTDLRSLFDFVNGSGRFTPREILGTTHRFNHVDGVTVIQVFNHIGSFSPTGTDTEKEQQRRFYDSTVMLHPYQVREDLHNPKYMRALANVVVEFGEYILREDVPSCFPRSVGHLYRGDNSRRVYYPRHVSEMLF